MTGSNHSTNDAGEAWAWQPWAEYLQPKLLDAQSDVAPQERHAAIAIVLRPQPFEDVLFMVRAPRPDDPWSGQVSFPGGHREIEDISLLHTAQRETLEEVGLDLSRCATPLGRLPDLQARARGKRVELMVTPFVFMQTDVAPLRLGPEASHSFRMPLLPLLEGTLDAEKQIQRDAVIQRYPAWQHDDHLVWGMTYHVMSGLLEHLRGPGGLPGGSGA